MGKTCTQSTNLLSFNSTEDGKLLVHLSKKLIQLNKWPVVGYNQVVAASWKCAVQNQKDVKRGLCSDTISKKKRITKEVEPMVYRMRRNMRFAKRNPYQIDDDIKQLTAWQHNFTKMTMRTGYRYRDHCYQLQGDLIELRFYLEHLYQEVVDKPSVRFTGLVEQGLADEQEVLA